MKTNIFIATFFLYGFFAMAQVKIGNNTNQVNPDAILEMESENQGLLHPRVALTALANAAPLTAHIQGMIVYNTALVNNVVPGLYINDGTKWVQLSGESTATGPSLSAVCNGFLGNYRSGNDSNRSYKVTLVNNGSTVARITPSVRDLTVTRGLDIRVRSVSPAGNIAIPPGESVEVNYIFNDSLRAVPNTVITGTFNKLGLYCSKTVTLGNIPPTVSAGIAQSILLPGITRVNLAGGGTDSDGTISRHVWSRTGGTGTANVTIVNPSDPFTSVTGITIPGTYVFTFTATDNLGASSQATVTITAVLPTGTVNGNNGSRLTFMSHNLGANYGLNPLTPSPENNGNYYQWGKKQYSATANTPQGDNEGWNNATPAGNAWAAVKTTNDPCPLGYRVPTAEEIKAAVTTANGNTISYVGTWENSVSNFSSGMNISTDGFVKLFFPAAGLRNSSGYTGFRGSQGNYWTSTSADGVTASFMRITDGNVNPDGIRNPVNASDGGFSIRCIKE